VAWRSLPHAPPPPPSQPERPSALPLSCANARQAPPWKGAAAASLRDDVLFVNCKIFQNGSIQMTGLKYVDQGLKVIGVLSAIVSRMFQKPFEPKSN
jgi:hypothetical protein